MADTYLRDEVVSRNLAITPYLGYVDNRGMWPDAVASSGAAQQVMVRNVRYARSTIMFPRPRWLIGAYYTSTGVLTLQTGTAYSIRASIEYPAGTFTQLTFGGQVTGTYNAGQIAMPDPILVGIPRFSTYFVKYWIDSPNGYPYTNNYAGLTGDAANVGATTADLTMSAMAGSSPGAVGHGPIGVVDMTNQRSFFFIGDSLMAGHGTDTRDASGDFGVGARLVGAVRAYSNAGRSSTSAAQFITAGQTDLRVVEANTYATDIGCNYGVNDCLSGIPAATTAANLRTIRSWFPAKRFYQHTITPVTNGAGSAWALLDASDQVTNTTASPLITTLNLLLMAGNIASNAMSFTGIIHTSAASSYQLNAQKQDPGLTADGIHLAGLAGGPSGYVVVAGRSQGVQQLLN